MDRIIDEKRAMYKSIVSVFCPILDETVYFTSDGFQHLLYKSNRKPRKLSERYMKLMSLEHAKTVITSCTFVSQSRIVRRKIKGTLRDVVRHELVHEVKQGVQIRVVVEKIGTGKAHFLSVMPHNRRSKPQPKKHLGRRL